jgi:type IV pilus assembly protein PilW
MTTRRPAAGFTLVAFVIALALGAFLLLLATELVLASRRSLLWQDAAAQLERAGELALDALASELRMAGFRGLVSTAAMPPGAPGCGTADGWALALQPALAFADRGTTATLQLSDGSEARCLPAASLQPGSDLLALRRSAALPSLAGAGSSERFIRDTQWYLAADASGGGEFLYLGAGETVLPADGREYREWRTAIFYVRDYSVAPADGLPTLCVERLMGAGMRSECLVEGVERLHVEFAVDHDGDGRSDARLAVPTADELSRAVGATIYLQLRSVAALPGVTAPDTLQLGSEHVTLPPDDSHLHRVFVRTVPLSNHG